MLQSEPLAYALPTFEPLLHDTVERVIELLDIEGMRYNMQSVDVENCKSEGSHSSPDRVLQAKLTVRTNPDQLQGGGL